MDMLEFYLILSFIEAQLYFHRRGSLEHFFLVGIFHLIVAVGHNNSCAAFGCNISLTGPKGQKNIKILQSTPMGKSLTFNMCV